MKDSLKRIYYSSLLLCQTIISVLSVALFSSFKIHRQISKLRNSNAQEGYILGNGPSLKEELTKNFDFFEKNHENTLCVNLFCEDPIFRKLKPGYYLIVDSGFWNNENKKNIIDIQNNFILQMKNVDWNLTLFIPIEGKSFYEKKLNNDFLKICYFNTTPVNGFRYFSHYLYRKNLGMPAPHNVLCAGIFMFININFKKINIYGADHSWISDLYVDENNDLWSYQNHFYDNEKIAFKLKKGSLYGGLQGIIMAFQSYELLKLYSESVGSQIINKTKKSFLDIFEYE